MLSSDKHGYIYISIVFIPFLLLYVLSHCTVPNWIVEGLLRLFATIHSGTHANGNSTGIKTILLWNALYRDANYHLGQLGMAPFQRTKCAHICYMTNNRSKLADADAVVVHTYNMAPGHQNSTIPTRRNQGQIFVFFIMESPTKSYKGFIETDFRFADVFNLTFTYLRSPKTDVLLSSGGIHKLRKRNENAGLGLSSIVKKSKLIVWLVSNCRSFSARNEYASQLSKYAEVDVFGKCGNLTCRKGNSTCIREISETYMFYLAFENSFCKDYVTEKAFRPLTKDLVPIVYGYANYSKMLPPNSYIDVRDYESPEALAKYLYYLKANRFKYQEYFEWRKQYVITPSNRSISAGFCKLCSILYNPQYRYKSKFDPVKDYWNPNKLCLTPDKEKRLVHLADK